MCGNNDYIQELLLNYFFQCRSYVDFTIRQTENDIEIARVEGVTEAEVVDARAVLKELQRRTRGENIFAIVLLTMKEHPQNGDLARCCCQILLDLYYTSAEDKNALLEKGLIHEPTGKAIVGGNTLDEVFQKWNTEEVSLRSKI